MTLQAGDDQFGFYAALVLAFLFCLVYLGVGLRVLREDQMGSKVAQFYGYSVCLVSIVAFLVCVGSLAGAIIESGDPLHASVFTPYPQRSLASFDTYKMDVLNPPAYAPQSNAPRYTPDDATLRRMYEASRAERLEDVRLQLRRSVVTNTLIIVVALILFVVHWRWVRRVAI